MDIIILKGSEVSDKLIKETEFSFQVLDILLKDESYRKKTYLI